jgi:hypothetical protein
MVGRDHDMSLGVHVYQAGGVASPVIVLTDTETIDPKIANAKMAGNDDCILERLGKIRQANSRVPRIL